MRSTCWFAVVLCAAAIPSRATVLDDFTSPDQSVCSPISFGSCAGPSTSSVATATNTFAGYRTITIVSLSGGVVAADVAAGQLTVTVDPLTTADLTVQWQVFSLDLTKEGSGIGFHFGGGLGGQVAFTITNAGGAAAIGPLALPNSGGTFTFPFADFVGDLTVLNSADELTFKFESNTGSGGTVDDLSAQGRFFALGQNSITFDDFGAVPEPSTLAVLGPALAGLLAYRYRLGRHSSRCTRNRNNHSTSQ